MASNQAPNFSSEWPDLQDSIKDAVQSKELNVAQLVQIMSSYKSKEEDWDQFAHFNETTYTRNLVDAGNGRYNLMILAWNPGQKSCIHDHAKSSCVVKVLAGSIKEIRYEMPRKGKDFAVIGEYRRLRDDVAYIDDTIGVHEMMNDAANQSVTLHLYTPPFEVCNRFDRQTARKGPCTMTFTSIYGGIIQKEVKTEDDEVPNPCC